MLSILIPIYNFAVKELVNELSSQAQDLNIPFEILCDDDASKATYIKLNEGLEKIKGVNYQLNKKNIGLIYTFFNTNNFNNSIKNISIMKKQIKMPISYGNHFNKIDEVVKVKKHNPSEIFLYIKMNENLEYPDNKHAVPLNKIANMVKKLKK